MIIHWFAFPLGVQKRDSWLIVFDIMRRNDLYSKIHRMESIPHEVINNNPKVIYLSRDKIYLS